MPKIKRGFIKFWAHYENNGNQAIVNRLIKQREKELGHKIPSWEITLLTELIIKFKDRPLFYPEIERDILDAAELIREHRTNKKIYNRKRPK
jgi:hypothetical protein